MTTKRAFFHTQSYYDQQVEDRSQEVVRLDYAVRGECGTTDHLNAWLCQRIELLICRYSQGQSREALRASFKATLATLIAKDPVKPLEFFELDTIEPYYLVLSTFSLAILFEIDDAMFAGLVNVYENQRAAAGRDRLIDTLIAARITTFSPVETAIHPSTYEPLLAAIELDDAQERTNRLTLFMTEYDRRLGELSWHKGQWSGKSRSIGLWSFATAALVKLWRCDDALFERNIFYPSELVREGGSFGDEIPKPATRIQQAVGA